MANVLQHACELLFWNEAISWNVHVTEDAFQFAHILFLCGLASGGHINRIKHKPAQEFHFGFFSPTHYPNNLATSGAGLSEMYIRIDQNSHKLVLRTNASFSDMTTSWSSPAASSVSFRSCIYIWNVRINIYLGCLLLISRCVHAMNTNAIQANRNDIGCFPNAATQSEKVRCFFHRYVQCSNYLKI